MIIAFWSPVAKTGQTSNIFALSAEMVLKKNKRVLMINANYNKKDFEAAILPEDAELLSSIGIDWVLRNAKIQGNSIRTAAIAFYNEHLHVITGTEKRDIENYHAEMQDYFPMVLENAGREYDVIAIDTPSGSNELSDMIMGISDLVVVNLPQNVYVIRECLKKPIERKKVFLLSNYCEESRYNRKNLERIFKPLKKRTAVMAHNVGLMDAFNGTGIIKYLHNGMGKDRSFSDEVRRAAGIILREDDVAVG